MGAGGYRGRPKGSKIVDGKLVLAKDLPHVHKLVEEYAAEVKAEDAGVVEEMGGEWEMKRVGSVAFLYASFDTCRQFWVERGRKTGRVVRIKLKAEDGMVRDVVVEDVKDAKAESVRMYWPKKLMSPEWLYGGKNPYEGSFRRGNAGPVATKEPSGLKVVAFDSGKV